MHSILGLVLISAAAAHRLQLAGAQDLKAYTTSPLIYIELILMVLLLILLVVPSPIYAIYLIVKKQWRDLGVLAINCVLGTISLVAAMAIDSSTLIFAT
jgi:hypothetical protein